MRRASVRLPPRRRSRVPRRRPARRAAATRLLRHQRGLHPEHPPGRRSCCGRRSPRPKLDLGAVAWSPDGRYLAVERNDSSAHPLIMVLDLLEPDPWASAAAIRSPEFVGYRFPVFRNDGRLVAVEQYEDRPAVAQVLDPVDGSVVATFSLRGRRSSARPTTPPAPGSWSPWPTAGCAGSAAATRATWPTGFIAADWSTQLARSRPVRRRGSDRAQPASASARLDRPLRASPAKGSMVTDRRAPLRSCFQTPAIWPSTRRTGEIQPWGR